MILKKEYKADLIDFIQGTSQQVFAIKNTSRSDVLHNSDIMDKLWCAYQKAVEDYDTDPEEAYINALESVIGIPANKARKYFS